MTVAGAIPGWPAGATARQASVAVVDGEAVVVFRDPTSDLVWRTQMASDGTWGAWSTVPTDFPVAGSALESYYTPGLVAAVDGREYLATVDPDKRSINFLSRPVGSTGDFELSPDLGVASLFIPTTPDAERTRLNLLFLPYLDATGTPFADGSGYLALFLMDADGWRRAYSAGYITPVGASLLDRDSFWRGQGSLPKVVAETSLGVVRRGDAATLIYVSEESGAAGPVIHVPYANGLPEVAPSLHDDHNDAARMADNMCGVWNLTCSARCTDPTAICGGSTPEGEEVECEPSVPPS